MYNHFFLIETLLKYWEQINVLLQATQAHLRPATLIGSVPRSVSGRGGDRPLPSVDSFYYPSVT